MALCSCGYQFSSAENLPNTAQTIYIAKFSNPSLQTGVQDAFARYMKDEIDRHARLQVVDDPSSADLQLAGVIERADSFPQALNAVGEPTVYNLNMALSATLYDNRSHKVLWSAHDITNQEQYAVVPQAVLVTSPQFLRHNLRATDIAALSDSQTQQIQLATSRDDAMADVARKIYAAMVSGF